MRCFQDKRLVSPLRAMGHGRLAAGHPYVAATGDIFAELAHGKSKEYQRFNYPIQPAEVFGTVTVSKTFGKNRQQQTLLSRIR